MYSSSLYETWIRKDSDFEHENCYKKFYETFKGQQNDPLINLRLASLPSLCT